MAGREDVDLHVAYCGGAVLHKASTLEATV
jgi:hypothetical protein